MDAVIYARYSSHAQKDASIEQQVAECRRWADANDVRIVATYSDHALSGTTDSRPEFLRMIRDSAHGRWQRVLVYKVDRFARNRYDSAMYKARLKKYGVNVVSVTEPIPEGPEGILLESVLEGSAEYYSANLAQNVRRGMLDNARACKVNSGILPFGYCKGPDGRYAADPDLAPYVLEIYRRFAAGESIRAISDSLSARGLRTSMGAPFGHSSLSSILRNERYTGVYIWGDVRVEGGTPALIPRELYDAVQSRLHTLAHAPAAGRKVDYQLTGKLFCGRCGCAMTGLSGTSGTGTSHYYYACTAYRRHACTRRPLHKDALEEYVVRSVRERCLSDTAIAALVEAALQLQARDPGHERQRSLSAQLAGVDRSIQNLLTAIEQGINGESTLARMRELEERRRTLCASIEQARLATTRLTRDQLTCWLESFRTGSSSDPAFQSTFFSMFISRVYIYDDHLRIVFRSSPNAADDLSFPLISSLGSTADPPPDALEVFAFQHQMSTKNRQAALVLADFYLFALHSSLFTR